jgi:hypothetical protein
MNSEMIEVEGRSAKCEGVGTPIGPPSSVYIRLSQGPHERRMMLTHFRLAAAVYPGAGKSAKIRELVMSTGVAAYEQCIKLGQPD